MQTLIKKIKLDDTLKELLLSFLLKEKHCVPCLSKEQESLISFISETYLISGFVLNSCAFNLSHKNLVQQLKYQRRIQVLKQMSVKTDLSEMAHNLNKKGINYVFLKGAALNCDGIYQGGIRASRDLDLLVSIDQLSEAYDILKRLGYKYSNQRTQDLTKYHFSGNHFCEMVNDRKTKLEMHWRVTTPNHFKECPLTENVLAKRRISNLNSHIFCPKIEFTIAHLIHHSFAQHNLNLGPTVLFDLAAIYNFFEKKWPINKELNKKLGIEKNFELCKELIERASDESRFSSKSKLLANQIFGYSHWLRVADELRIRDSLLKTSRAENFEKLNFFSKALFKFRYTRTLYQVSYFSVKFWLFLGSDIFTDLRKMMRGYFN